MDTTAVPAAEAVAAALADTACTLADSSTGRWSTAAAEDAAEAIEITAEALAAAHPETTAAVRQLRQAVRQLRRDLGLTQDQDDEHDQAVEVTAAAAVPGSARHRRRGLGPGFSGVRIPPDRPPADRPRE
ncbi:hypothetical protein [Streptomyces jumonjinensis]|uniref:hypothetical protein n=1 Tax=Streptomyces jumonjinensis TaxID=1945 RepID=UPI0037963E53